MQSDVKASEVGKVKTLITKTANNNDDDDDDSK